MRSSLFFLLNLFKKPLFSCKDSRAVALTHSIALAHMYGLGGASGPHGAAPSNRCLSTKPSSHATHPSVSFANKLSGQPYAS